ncbi:putative leucine-rich repeat domain, L domain-containing protein [Lupinus albus]|uniref:Putative leucine-rich repeat domain, L domain-containing protein n=1 Tax=Lupinus albus TaxID=3870 RepID=A0A6A4R7R4_LUPAL|nr:putative leucine-rich repeat domain, L domain-containing protein [Lupinus albus]
MPSDLLIYGKLQRYKIMVGDGWTEYSETSRTLKFKPSSTTTTSLDVGIKMLLEGVEDLSLAEVKGVRNVFPELNGEGFPLLKHLLVENCDEILYIIDSTKCLLPSRSFLCLETLLICHLINLEKICCGQFPIIANLSSFSMARDLTKLLHIDIYNCKFLTNVIVEQEEECEDNEQIKFKI